MPTVKQLQHFRAIFEIGTIQGASESVHISQPALTRSIGNLEDELGLQLFERSKSGMHPTLFAEQIAPQFTELLLKLDDIQRDAALHQSLEVGQLAIGLGQAIREPVLRHCLPAFAEQYPGVSLAVREGTAPELTTALQRREIDMIVAGSASYSEHDCLIAERILNIPVLVLVRRGHPLTKRKRIGLDDLLSFPQAAPTVLGSQHPFREKIGTETNQFFQPHYLCSDYLTLESIVRRTDAWTIALSTKLHRDLPGELSLLKVVGFDLTIELSVIELKQRSRSPAANHFVETMKSILIE